jgi:curved DNA-binding protein CbpA
MPRSDPYATLGVSRSAPDAEIRAAYRRLVLQHHPDHNGGSKESTRRFEEVQEAYAEVRRLRSGRGARSRAGAGASGGSGAARTAGGTGPTAGGDGGGPDGIDARLAEMERDVKNAARAARESAAKAARDAQGAMRDARDTLLGKDGGERPSDEELGYYKTDDSLSKILDDAASGLSERFSAPNRARAANRLADVIEDLGAKLSGDHHKHDS